MKDLTNQVYGRLTVLNRIHRDKKYNWYWECLCTCGNKTIVHTQHLRAGHTQSCGCLFKEYQASRIINKKHPKPYNGDEVDRFYRTRNSYKAMIRRCYDNKFLSYTKYGGKGITVCDRWRFGDGTQSGWRCFLFDMGQRPKGYTLDRKENSMGYNPENCRWATRQQQEANKVGKIPSIF